MRVENNKINPQALPDATAAKPKARGASGAAAVNADLEVTSTVAPYVQAAMAAGDVNETAVAQARQALQVGTLDTPEAAANAAAKMLESL
jgi:hypothetical protein